MSGQHSAHPMCAAPAEPAGLARNRGFTLIELLVAISILAMVAVLGWRGLDGIVRARVTLSTQLEQTRGMQLTFAQLQNDCAHIAGSMVLPDRMALVHDAGRLTLVRTVIIDDQPTRLQVVSYRLKDGVLTRRESTATRDLDALDKLWVAATNDADASQEVVLQTGVDSMTTRAWVPRTGWINLKDIMGQTLVSTSTGGSPAMDPPTGLEVSLVLQGAEASLVKIFLLGAV